ncbi:hypothetical protein BSKO_03645 [Bryopsis sp. KO-2023]|nr:hypothetical protein BSKO_03645 [Bryopsis sp. KO-2023]
MEMNGVAQPPVVDEEALKGKLSVCKAFKGANVFLTGVTGYVGSLVLEHLLRVCPDVNRVYVLIRGKKTLTAKVRLEKLLSTGLFNKLWDRRDILEKITLLEGDVTQTDLGLHASDKAELVGKANFAIHSAAAVNLDDPIQKTLKNNYMSTRNVLELCKQMTNFRSYVHVSTAYVNITFKSGATVKEKIFPLMHGDTVVTHKDIVPELLRLNEEDAQIKADMVMRRFNFPNTYCLGKRMTEELVNDYFKNGLPCTIVRPSLITGVAKDPYPGYIGNLAGGAGFAIAFAIGFFEQNSMAWTANGVCDIVPGDQVSSVVLAAAASTAECRIKDKEIPIFHACTTTSYPLSNHEMYCSASKFFTKEPPPYCLLWGPYPTTDATYEPNDSKVYWAKKKTELKVKALSWILNCMGKSRIANRLYIGWMAWDFGNQSRYDMNLYFSVENVRTLDHMLVEEERKDIRLLHTPQTSDWTRYMRTYLAGIKALLLKTPLIDSSTHDFRVIPPLETPLSLPSSVERRPSMIHKRTESKGAMKLVPKKHSIVSGATMAALGRTLSFVGDGAHEEEEEDVELSDSDTEEEEVKGVHHMSEGADEKEIAAIAAEFKKNL